jgi:hypothetical protein
MAESPSPITTVSRDVLAQMTDLLPAFSLVNLYLTGSKRIGAMLLSHNVVREFAMGPFDGAASLLPLLSPRPRSLTTLLTLKIPRLIYNLPSLSKVVLCWHRGCSIRSQVHYTILDSLPASLAHLTLRIPISLTIKPETNKAYNLGAKFPALRVLEVGHQFRPVPWTPTPWKSFARQFPASLEVLQLEGLQVPDFSAFMALLPPNVCSLSISHWSSTKNVTLERISSYPFRELTLPNLSSMDGRSAAVAPPNNLGLAVLPSLLTSLNIRAFPVEFAQYLPPFLRVLKILKMLTPPGHQQSEWVHFVSSLPRSLKVLHLPAFAESDSSYANPPSISKPLSYFSEQLIENMFPPTLEAFQAFFSSPPFSPNQDLSSSYKVKFPDTLTSLGLAGFNRTHTHMLKDAPLVSPFYLPRSITSLQLPPSLVFLDEYWNCFPNLRYLTTVNITAVGYIPERAIFSESLPKSLISIRVSCVLLDGWSWNVLQEATQPLSKHRGPHFGDLPLLPQNTPEAIQKFLDSIVRCNMNSYIEAFKRAVTLRYPYETPKIEARRFRLSYVVALPPMATSVKWRQISLAREFDERLGTLPLHLQCLNLKNKVISFQKLCDIPQTIQRVIGLTVEFQEWDEMDELVLQLQALTNWPRLSRFPTLNLLGSFSLAISLLYPNIVNCHVVLGFELGALQALGWMTRTIQKLHLKKFLGHPSLTSEALLPNIHRFQALQVLDCYWDYCISDPSIFDTMTNLHTMRVKLEPSFVRGLPRSLTHLRIDCVHTSSNAAPSDWPPNLTYMELLDRTQSFVHSLAPEIMPQLQTLILNSDGLNDEQVGKFPRSITWLRIDGTKHNLSFPRVPPSLTYFQVQGIPSDSILILRALAHMTPP